MSGTIGRLSYAYLLIGSMVAVAVEPPPPPEAPAAVETPGQPESPSPAPPRPVAGDPFQQVPLDRMTPAQRKTAVAPIADATLVRAAEHFRKKDYAQADLAFAQAALAKMVLSADEKIAWGYCQLAELSTRVASEADPAKLEALEVRTKAALALGGPRLESASRQLLERIAAKRAVPVAEKAAAPVVAQTVTPTAATAPVGWEGLETANFRILWKSIDAERATEVAAVVEAARSAMYLRWTASDANPVWKPKCELRIHPDLASLKVACPNGDEQGCSAVDGRSGSIVHRRMDLVAGSADLLDTVVPREVAFLIVSELFADEPLQRWAEVGMTALAESPTQVRRYLRTARLAAKSGKLFPLATLVKMADFPDPARISEFYAQSVSLVDFLVRRKGAVAFASLLRETPRRGFEECLKRHYGFANVAELEAVWLREVSGGK